MKRFIAAFICAIFTAIQPVPSSAQSYDHLFREFDARYLTHDDKRLLQLALAFEGVYNGLIDGAWGGMSQRAMDSYAMREFGTRSEDWHMALLAFRYIDRHSNDGWDIRFLSGLGMSILVPEKALVVDPPSDNFVNFRHRGSSLSVSYGRHATATANNIHDFTLKQRASGTKPYVVRKSHLAVSSVTKPDGTTLYTRTNRVDGLWSTIMVSASRKDKNILNAVVASIATGRSARMTITQGGRLDLIIREALAIANAPDAGPSEGQTVAAPPPDKDGEGSTGSGFFVSARGHVMTNAHVIDGCTNITVDGEPASLVDTSDIFDLAILHRPGTGAQPHASFAARPARLNSDVTAVGFPYGGVLGGLNVTRGAVSAMKGFDNNSVRMQISAPVQSGNSGGPLLSSDGTVVGVVVAKLDAVKVAAALGDLPQNVNYAVRGELAKLFMSQNGIDPTLADAGPGIAPEDLAEQAKAYTVFIECR
ncbi:S1C family serine protease [Pseudooceanicola onchidii]|uniref:S1C family serine protease n=1 Tax=Pseudooceanicola onchidii TaxID=2562279 RepID=UPI0010A9F3F2|nr:trypsin-like peptidase domain-containing protein [Pseudooceanicola onchidii]